MGMSVVKRAAVLMVAPAIILLDVRVLEVGLDLTVPSVSTYNMNTVYS